MEWKYLKIFNRCRKLNIKLHIKDKIEEFSRLFNSITDRRALESLRLSTYAEDIDKYIKLLSEENTSVGVILETLSSFNIEINLTSDTTNTLNSRQIVIRTGNNAVTSKDDSTKGKEFLNLIGKEAVSYPKINIDRTTNVTPTEGTAPTENVRSRENFIKRVLNEIEESHQKSYSIPEINYEDEEFYESEDILTNVGTALTKNVPTKNADSNSLVNRLLTASIFGTLVFYLIHKFIRPAQRLWEYLMNKNNKPKSRQMSDKQQQTIEKYAKILEIKEKLPMIIQNVEI
ncbi:hypothetical protein RhiirC2_789177 [Rhizophagus irregularis]|uniref:Uncharacterized protein n=1 Tax=Rhizophagus irregularis TaxID=588596 RepID=A0A2N1MNR8_9GLOM|nr:hypothetical protein RhiirC2_789177 [Rhizophagus irregularis]